MAAQTGAPAHPELPALARVLGRADLVLFTVCAILTIDTLASSAAMGFAWFSWWAITMTVFFIPYGLITAELGSAWPGEGGVYIWVREAFGPKWGSTAAWLYWINNATWIPSVYLIFAGTFGQMFLKTQSAWQDATIAIVLTWVTVLVGVVRLEVSKWVPNVGAVVKALIFLALGVLGLSALFRGQASATPFSASALIPRWNDSLAYLPALLYSTFGFELMSSAGGEMQQPQARRPQGDLLVGGADRDPLLLRHRRDPLRGADREALDRDGDLGRAGRSREGVGTRRATRWCSSWASGFSTRASPTS